LCTGSKFKILVLIKKFSHKTLLKNINNIFSETLTNKKLEKKNNNRDTFDAKTSINTLENQKQFI
jgi:hypothetical protein